VRIVSGVEVAVDSPDGSTLDYWHIHPSVFNGEAAIAYRTVLGHVLKSAKHVHLSEYDHGTLVNPLERGHLHPYRDRTTPHVRSITIRRASNGAAISPLTVRGRVKLIADAYDMPWPRVPGSWAGMPITPALVEWRLQLVKGQIAIPETIAADFRHTLPPRGAFWDVYARGTYQNMSVFGSRLADLEPGKYLFNLTPKGLDTRHLRYGNNFYDIVVTAVDIRGNASTTSERITVRN
jgi:hypothetical protein